MKSETQHIDSEDITKARMEVDRIYEIHRKGSRFAGGGFEEAIKKASRRIGKPTPSPKQLKT